MSYRVIATDYKTSESATEQVYAVWHTRAPSNLISTWILRSDAQEESNKLNLIDVAMETTWEDNSGRIFK